MKGERIVGPAITLVLKKDNEKITGNLVNEDNTWGWSELNTNDIAKTKPFYQKVFGWGLKRNVINLYSFLCRNHKAGDQIYAFGFSRGAFTIRVLVGLIAAQGIVPYKDESDLAHQAHDTFAIADVGDAAFDNRAGFTRRERLRHRIERRLRILDHQ